ncbi:hypothetical protein C8Q80DRAFT_516678 [Daedaleopsis nitida]|nr:hypothetical protein C8Q80DRAFT_516678 [Daedaleopsis nitida]
MTTPRTPPYAALKTPATHVAQTANVNILGHLRRAAPVPFGRSQHTALDSQERRQPVNGSERDEKEKTNKARKAVRCSPVRTERRDERDALSRAVSRNSLWTTRRCAEKTGEGERRRMTKRAAGQKCLGTHSCGQIVEAICGGTHRFS